MKKIFFLILATNSIINCFSQTSWEYLNRGITKAQQQDYQGAIADYNKAIEINPIYEKAYNNRGIAKGNLQDNRGAIADFNKAIEINPIYEDAYYNRGLTKTKTQLHDYRGAIADYNKTIGINPKNAEAYYGRGIAKFALKQKEGGCLDWSKAGELGYEKAYELIKKYCN